MRNAIESLATKMVDEPEKAAGAAVALASAAPVLIPVVVVGTVGYSLFKLISNLKK